MSARIACLLLAAAAAGRSADRDFDRLAKGIEEHYGIRRLHIPLMGVANFAMKVGHPAGAAGFKLAVFQNLDECPRYKEYMGPVGDAGDLDRLMANLASGLDPLIRVRSHGESSYIYSAETGKATKLVIANFDRREATVIEVKVDIETLMRLIANPLSAGHAFDGDDPRLDR